MLLQALPPNAPDHSLRNRILPGPGKGNQKVRPNGKGPGRRHHIYFNPLHHIWSRREFPRALELCQNCVKSVDSFLVRSLVQMCAMFQE
jgi:hypothetical protein